MLDSPTSSVADLNSRVDILRQKISQPETEDSWEIISKGLKSLGDLCSNGACDFPAELISILRSISRPLINSMVSERTRLSGVAIDLTSTVATGLGTSFDPLLPIFLPVLLSLCGRTNKVIITRARACITNIIETTQLPSILPYFLQSIKDKSTSIRLTAAEGTLMCMNCFNPPDLEKDARARDIETIIRTTARDAQADIRAVSRKIFEAYKLLLPARVESFTAPLSPKMKKYLDIKVVNMRTETLISRLPSTLDAKNQLSSSTSAVSTTRGRTELGPPVTHARSASSSAISTDRRTVTAKSKASGTITMVNRQKPTNARDMPPPPYIPVRPTQSSNAVSVSRSTSAVETRLHFASTAPAQRPGATVVISKAPAGLPARPTSANSHGGVSHCPQPLLINPSGPSQELSSGPRRVPLPDAQPKGSETNKKQQVDVARPRVNSAAPRLLHTDVKAVKARANQPLVPPVREKPKPVPNVGGSGLPGASLRAAKSVDVPEKAMRSGGVLQPTLSQLSRAKATAERKPPSAPAPKQLRSRPASKPSSSSASSQSTLQKAKTKLGPAAGSGGKRLIEPSNIPLPSSPVQSTVDISPSHGEEPSTPSEIPPAPLLASVTLPAEDFGAATVTGEVAQQECLPGAGEGMNLFPIEESSGDGATALTECRRTPALLSTGQEDEAADFSEAIARDGDGAIINSQAHETTTEATSEVLTWNTTPPRMVLLADTISDSPSKTPISSLLSSIQRGFLFTPSSPLSPPQSYLARGPGMQDLPIPFPLSADGSEATQDNSAQRKKPFMFGVRGEDYGRSTLGNVENLNVQK